MPLLMRSRPGLFPAFNPVPDYRILALNFEDGTDGNQDAIDQSPAATSLTWNGASAIVKAIGTVEGTKCLQLNISASASRLEIPAIDFGDDTGGDFTIEMYVNVYSRSPTFWTGHIGNLDSGTTGSWTIYTHTDGTIDFFVTPGTLRLVGSTAIPLSTWTHVAIDRTGNVHRAFIGGVMDAKQTISGAPIYGAAAGPIFIGTTPYAPVSDSFHGYMDMIRITKGVSLYGSDSSFTPPVTL